MTSTYLKMHIDSREEADGILHNAKRPAVLHVDPNQLQDLRYIEVPLRPLTALLILSRVAQIYDLAAKLFDVAPATGQPDSPWRSQASSMRNRAHLCCETLRPSATALQT